MIDVLHEPCGGIAFRLRCTIEEAREGVILNSAMIHYDDERTLVDDDGTITTGSLLLCQACGRGLGGPITFVGDQLVATGEW